MLDVLHWLPLQQRTIFRIGGIVWRCILGLAPAYLRDLCCPSAPRAAEVAVHSAHRNTGYSLFLLLVPPQPMQVVHSRWLAPLCGMDFFCHKDCSPGFFLTHSTLA